jgi:hypothetical protein
MNKGIPKAARDYYKAQRLLQIPIRDYCKCRHAIITDSGFPGSWRHWRHESLNQAGTMREKAGIRRPS